MMEERYHATTWNRFYPDMSNVNKNITVEAKLIRQPTYFSPHETARFQPDGFLLKFYILGIWKIC